MPEIVRLLGRYDCFGHKGTDEEQKVLEFQYGARAIMTNYEECYNYLIDEINDDEKIIINTILNNGKHIFNFLKTEAKQIYKRAFEIKMNNPDWDTERGYPGCSVYFKFLCVNQERFNPINFDINYPMN